MLFDCHCHTPNSHDANTNLQDICQNAIEKGIAGVAFTDHCDLEYAHEKDVFSCILKSVADANAMQKAFAGRLQVFRGVEICEFIYNPEAARKAITMADYDVILGSIHSVRFGELRDPFVYIDFSQFCEAQIPAYLQAYFKDMLETVQNFDFDILCHFTIPLRYICGKYGYNVNMEAFAPQIDEILRTVIQKGIAVECNTANINPNTVQYCPDCKILARYYALGGRKVTLGADAHVPQNVGRYLPWAVEQLKQIGFSGAYYFKNRQAIYYDFC